MQEIIVTEKGRTWRVYRSPFNPHYIMVRTNQSDNLTVTERRGNKLHAVGCDPWGEIVETDVPLTAELKRWLKDAAPVKDSMTNVRRGHAKSC